MYDGHNLNCSRISETGFVNRWSEVQSLPPAPQKPAVLLDFLSVPSLGKRGRNGTALTSGLASYREDAGLDP
jgi:hypothetical protein